MSFASLHDFMNEMRLAKGQAFVIDDRQALAISEKLWGDDMDASDEYANPRAAAVEFELMQWCREHIKGLWRISPHDGCTFVVQIEKKSEAVRFKLTWLGN